MPTFKKIDMHTHILPENLPNLTEKFGYGDFIFLEHHCCDKAKMFKGKKFFREVEENCYRPEPRMEDSHVDVQVLSTVPVMFSYWAKPEDTLELCIMLNDHIAEICNKYPKRFVGLGTVPMQAPELAIQEIKRCMEIGLCGIQIATHINDKPLSHPDLFPIFEAAEQANCSIFVHPWDMVGFDLMEKYWLPWLVSMPAESSFAICSLIFGGVFERLPNLRFLFAHGGGSFPATIGRIEKGFTCRPDLCAIDNKVNPREYCGKFWVDSLCHDPVALKVIVDLVGDNKVALGTDYPFPLGEWDDVNNVFVPGKLIESVDFLTDQQKQDILWRNGLEFLGITEDRFLDDNSDQKETIEAKDA